MKKLSEQEQKNRDKLLKTCIKELIEHFGLEYIYSPDEEEPAKNATSIIGSTKEEVLKNIRNGCFYTGCGKNQEY